MVCSFWKIGDEIPEVLDGPHRIQFRQATKGRRQLPNGWTHFGFFGSGSLRVKSGPAECSLRDGGFFRSPGQTQVDGGNGFIVSLEGDHGFFQIGGPFDVVGRLPYPPGGEQNCLIWPAAPLLASLNYLKMTAAEGWQTEHTHPSLRLNIVLSGQAKCKTHEGVRTISAGDVVLLGSHEKHAFGEAAPSMTFVAFHPDSARDVFIHSPMPANTNV